MSKHLADKRQSSTGARLRQFLRLARESGRLWEPLWRHPDREARDNRRMQAFLRIARGHRS
jgi:hypothetical protein